VNNSFINLIRICREKEGGNKNIINKELISMGEMDKADLLLKGGMAMPIAYLVLGIIAVNSITGILFSRKPNEANNSVMRDAPRFHGVNNG